MATGRLPDPNTAPLTAKGDLYTYSTRGDRLAVGSNGDTLVADSSATTGLRWQGNFAAGKNKIINGDFNINQRAFSSSTTDGAYGFDRWLMEASGGATYSAQTFTPGTAPVAGYESRNFARIATTGQSGAGVYTLLEQKIENVRTFAGETVTVSLWAKAASAGAKIGLELSQSFGSGGSTQVNTQLGAITLTTSWARYSLSVAIPSISGKTIGTSDSLTLGLWTSAGTTFATRASSIGIQTATIDFWGAQVESGSVATAFQTATGTLAGELAACQRYYEKSYDIATAPGTNTSTGLIYTTAGSDAGNSAGNLISFKVTKRGTPTMTFYEENGTAGNWRYARNGVASTAATANAGYNGQNYVLGYVNSGTAYAVVNVQGHWVASAEL